DAPGMVAPATVLVAETVPAPPAASLAARMVTLATPLTSVSAVPAVGENTARVLSVAKVTMAFGTGFLLLSSTVALTVSGVAPLSALVLAPLALMKPRLTVGLAVTVVPPVPVPVPLPPVPLLPLPVVVPGLPPPPPQAA